MLRWLRMAVILLAVLTLGVGAGAPALATSPLPPPDLIRPEPWPLPVPVPPPPGRRPAPVRLEAMTTTAAARDGVVSVQVVQVFRNHGATQSEGAYLFPLPAGAVVGKFQMRVDGEEHGAELLDAGKARSIYEAIVAQSRDPALLQYVGRGLIQARVFPIPPGAERRVELSYDQVLARDAGAWELALPAGGAHGGAPRVQVEVRLEASAPLRTVYSPTHQVQVVRDGERRATVRYTGAGSGDLRLLYGGGQSDVAATLMTYRPGAEDGYFLLTLTPPATAAAAAVVPRDVVLVLDTSGSMAGAKITQAKQALRFVLERLNPGDRFNLVAFSSDVRPYADTLRPRSEWQAAAAWVDGLQAVGGTNISGALGTALFLARTGAEAGRPQYVVFLTDGLPTVGPQDSETILKLVAADATRDQRIFTFGVGFDVNTDLLDGLAAGFKGAGTYVRPDEDLEDAVSRFYAKVAQPVLADLALQLAGARTYDLYPAPLPDLFAGGQLVVLGRYSGDGPGRVTLTGHTGTGTRTLVYDDLAFARRDQAHDFIARLWAGRKIAYLLTQVRQGGHSREVVDEIVQLSLRYGILTPYTSFLVQEPGMAASPTAAREEAARKVMDAPPSGVGAVTQSATVGNLKAADSLQAQQQAPAAPMPAAGPTGATAAPLPAMQQVADRTFVQRDGIWTDTEYREGMTAQAVAFGSARYFELARRHPGALSVGLPLLVVLDGQAYQINDTGAPAEVPPAPPAGPGAAAPAPAPGGTGAPAGGRPGVRLSVGVGIGAALLLAGAAVWRRLG